jgi:AcrR family transcriptional regulator
MAEQGSDRAYAASLDEVAQADRDRLLDACTALLAERGYDGLRIGELATLAGFTPAKFHTHFPDKEACVIAGYDRFSARVIEAIFAEIDPTASWNEFVEAVLRGYIDVLEREGTAARAFYVEIDAAGPVARRRRRDAVHGFAAMLAERHQELRVRDPTLAELPPVAYLGIAFAIRGLVEDSLLEVDGPSFRELAPGIATLVSATVAGAAAAQGHARGDD